MKRINRTLYITFILVSIMMIFMAINAFADTTLVDTLNNLTGPKQQYNTMMSASYLRNNTSEINISSQSGDLNVTQTDYSLPGRNGLDLNITRIYKSGMASAYDMKTLYSNGVWVDYIAGDLQSTSFYEDRYNLGVGVRFSFPTIEMRNNSDGSSYKFLHAESGDAYRILETVTGGVTSYSLENHPVKDLIIKTDAGYSNGQSDGTSTYVMIEKSGKKTYFASDGRILGIVDRYGNTIKFEYLTLNYTVDGYTKTKRLISKITDTIGRIVNLEYKENPNFVCTQNPDGSVSGNTNHEFQVIVYLPDNTPGSLTDNKRIVYEKSAFLSSIASRHVVRTRIQIIYDIDNMAKYFFQMENNPQGFTFTNGSSYSVNNIYENLAYIDDIKSNHLIKFTYNTFKKSLSNSGSMQYRKIIGRTDYQKTGWDGTKPTYEEQCLAKIINSTTYAYTNEPDGFGYSGYNGNDQNYLINTYKYFTESTDLRGAKIKYTYNGVHDLLNTLESGTDHKEILVSSYDANRQPIKKERQVYNISNGTFVKKIQNYSYDNYGNLLTYTDEQANRDGSGNPTDSEHTTTYTYDINKYHLPTSKVWKLDVATTGRIDYTIDTLGNITRKKSSTSMVE